VVAKKSGWIAAYKTDLHSSYRAGKGSHSIPKPCAFWIGPAKGIVTWNQDVG
jgi:hypothetical protein